MARYCPYCVSRIESGDTCPFCNFSYTYRIKPHHLRPGTLLNDKYLVGRVLGEGGFGITYVGRDLTLDMKVAIKEYYPSNSATRINTQSSEVSLVDWTMNSSFTKGRAQFIHEAQTIAKMDKESAVVTVRDFFEKNNSAYIVMEFIEGQDLRDIVSSQNKPIDKKLLLPLLEPIFGALSEMHKIGLIHRDISPDNIMVENGRARLIDFGCTAKTVDMSNADKVLKHCFSPIEQYENSDMGPWSDVYAMAATIYYCLTGKLPPNAMERAQKDTLVPPSALGIKLLPKQERALMKALSLRKEGRYMSIEEFGKALFVHTNLYKYIAIAACGVAVIAVAAFMLFKPDTRVEALRVVNQPDAALTAADSLSSKEEDMLEKVSEFAADATMSTKDYYDVFTFTNTTGSDFEYLGIDVRYFNDDGIIVGYGSTQVSDVEDDMVFESNFYTNSDNASRVEVKITFPYNDKVYRTEYVPLSDDVVKGVLAKASLELLNTLPQNFTSQSYYGNNTYSVSEVVCSERYGSFEVKITGSMIDGQSNGAGNISYRVTNSSGAVMETGTFSLGSLRVGDDFVVSDNSYFDVSTGETYYVELYDYTY